MKKRAKGRSLGEEIIAGLREAVAYERGERKTVKVTRATLASQSAEVIPASSFEPRSIASLRERLQLSQPVFAAALNVSAETVKKWEQGTREPDGAALRLLEITDAHPEWIIGRIASTAAPAKRDRGRRSNPAKRSPKWGRKAS